MNREDWTYYISGPRARELSDAIYHFNLTDEESIRCSIAYIIQCFRDGNWVYYGPPAFWTEGEGEMTFENLQILRIKGLD